MLHYFIIFSTVNLILQGKTQSIANPIVYILAVKDGSHYDLNNMRVFKVVISE